MPSCHLHLMRPVNVRQQSQAEPVRARGVREPVDTEGGLRGVVRLPDPRVLLVVRNAAPIVWLGVTDRLHL